MRERLSRRWRRIGRRAVGAVAKTMAGRAAMLLVRRRGGVHAVLCSTKLSTYAEDEDVLDALDLVEEVGKRGVRESCRLPGHSFLPGNAGRNSGQVARGP